MSVGYVYFNSVFKDVNQKYVSLSCVSSGVDLVWRKFLTKIKILRN